MPILDPSLQCFLVKSIKETEGEDGYSFILQYLLIASQILRQNSSTIESSIQFKRDFEANIQNINEEFGCNFTKAKLFGSSFQRNCYKYFYKHLKVKNKEERSKKIRGIFNVCNDKFNTRFFRPYIFHSKYHSWFFTDTPIAILSIDSNLFSKFELNEKNQHKIQQMIKLEIDILSASGLLLILCINYTPIINNFLNQLIKDDQFSEIHCNIFNEDDIKPFLKHIEIKSDFLRGYFYLYCQFVDKNTEEQLLMKKLKKKAHVTVILFSKSPSKSLIKHKFYPTQPFFHTKSGNQTKYLRIFLTYVPIFDRRSDSESFIPCDISNLCLCYINSADFLIRKQARVQILFDDEIDQHHHKIKYVNYDDIHKTRADFFVEDTLSLTKLKETEIQRVNRIRSNVIQKIDNENKFRKDFLRNFLKIGNYEEFLKYVTYAYSHFIKSSISDFAIHRAQIYAALNACETCFSVKNKSNSKGVIYQVDTGEGKSCIICLIAAILVLKNYTVHIASSNIKLSNRDYFNSFEFFKLLGIKSAVLLHMNELPYNIHKSGNKNERDYEDEENQQKQLPLKNLYRYENDNFFKSNADYYFEVNTQKNEDIYKKSYPDKFFAPELFKNSSRMNFSVCGLDNDNNVNKKLKANVIFSTFVNFECFYLHLIEMCPGYIKPYFDKCGLLIDEADSFLIDEISNGTIVSREIRSNAKEILTFVYDQKEKGESAEKTFEELKKNPTCSDLKLIDVKEMYKDIEIAQSKEYSDGAHYKVKEFEVRNNHRIRNFIRKTVRSTINLSDTISDFIDQKLFNNDNDDDDDDDEDDEEFDTRASRTFKRVIPYDFKHKGILEPNKEFGGFVQQFISIKESRNKDNENLIFKDISINYLYISHPIFTNLYPKICGFTGTIGNAEDKKIYKNYYQLSTKKIPRNKINLRINLPIILCKNIIERNNKILQEVLTFHKKEIPVLIIFQELTEIDVFQKLLFENDIKYFNIFNGIDQYVLPDKIVGIKGSISLGTNVCARGTDILHRGKPLHVIVSFYSPNVRVMNQAFGRTARRGQSGTCRCICLISQYFNTYSNSKLIQMKKTVHEFEYKIEAQKKFIEYYKERYSWMFDYDLKIEKPKIPKNYIIEMRKARINVNRIVAYKYQYPICMSVKTFLEIQSQKIFSLFNCPNSKYTWILFQRYIREMILESWSLMIHKFEQKANLNMENDRDIETYKIQLNKKIEKLQKHLSSYLPKKDRDIFSTFMFIHEKVVKKYEKRILDSYKNLKKAYLPFEETSYTLFQLGFKPYSILNHSGARINYSNINETNFIKDPELKYQRKMPDNKFSFISITERIDMIFNEIFQKISSTLGEKVFLKFFLRRTLAGCEFGICFDINLINSDQELMNNKCCLIDKDPLLVFSVFLWSDVPLMAGVLIFILVYVIGLCSQITSWIESFPTEIPKNVIKQGAVSMIMLIVPEASGYFLGKIVDYLENILDEQIEKLLENDKCIIEEMRKIFVGHEYEDAGDAFYEKISSILGGSIRVSKKMGEIIKDSFQAPILMKIGFIMLLLLGTYIRSFMCRKDAIKHAEANAKDYDSTFGYEEYVTSKKLDEIVHSEKIDIELKEISQIEEKDKKTIVDSFNKVSETYYYKFKTLNLAKYQLNSSDFEKIKLLTNNSFNKISKAVYKTTNMKCLEIDYSSEHIDMINLVRILATNIHPAISTFFGYYNMNEEFSIIMNDNSCTFLSDYIMESNKKNEVPFLNSTEKLIIAYGLASALEFIHNNNIIMNDFRPLFVFLDSRFYPYIYDFSMSINVDDVERLENNFGAPLYMAPELIDKPDVSNPFAIDVYAYGVSLCQIITQTKQIPPYKQVFRLLKAIKEGFRPQIPDSTPLKWRKLIERCWDEDPKKRPTFTEICDTLESSTFVNTSINIVAFNDYKKIIKPYRPSK